MQTFLPYRTFYQSLDCLDYKRLGKQRVEAKQIIDILEGKPSRWKNHPAVRMWDGYVTTLKVYHNIAIERWLSRGYKNTMEWLILSQDEINNYEYPEWLTDEFCIAHRSNLLRKNYEFYKKYQWSVPINLPYVWPV